MGSSAVFSGRGPFKKAQWSLLKKNRTYIVPTKFGTAFAFVLLILFFFAVGYANNVIYFFVFFLISLSLVGMWLTNKNIEGLVLIQGLEPTLFAEEEGVAEVRVTSHNKEGSFELRARTNLTLDSLKTENVGYKETKEIAIKILPLKRGLHKAPKIIIESDFPFGLLRSWKTWQAFENLCVYPKLEGSQSFPHGSSAEGDLGNLGVFREHRTYSSADPLNRIDWKASARRAELLVKHFEEQTKNSLTFDWKQTSHLDAFERRVSQLALWVNEAATKGQNFTLKLGVRTFESTDVIQNWRDSMRALALLQKKDV